MPVIEESKPVLPLRIVWRVVCPFQQFFQLEASSGILIASVLAGLIGWFVLSTAKQTGED